MSQPGPSAAASHFSADNTEKWPEFFMSFSLLQPVMRLWEENPPTGLSLSSLWPGFQATASNSDDNRLHAGSSCSNIPEAAGIIRPWG